MVAEKFVVDLNKPLVFQVGHLGEDYEEWVHQPIMRKESPRFFHSSFLEFWPLVKHVCPYSIAPALYGGILLGYMIYDCTHYYLHHGQPKSHVPRNLKKYHLSHHYRVASLGFGVTSPLWDKVFGTFPPPSKLNDKR